MREADLPLRVVVGTNGAYWRDYGDGYSMCPVSEDNDPVEIAAVFVRSRITEAEEWVREAAALSTTPAPDLTMCFVASCTEPGHVKRVHEPDHAKP